MKARTRARGWALQALYAWEARRNDVSMDETLRQFMIDRNILRLGVAELLFVDDVPPRVTLREMIHLAERYGTPESPRFVNGVLDALMRRVRPGSGAGGNGGERDS